MPSHESASVLYYKTETGNHKIHFKKEKKQEQNINKSS